MTSLPPAGVEVAEKKPATMSSGKSAASGESEARMTMSPHVTPPTTRTNRSPMGPFTAPDIPACSTAA